MALVFIVEHEREGKFSTDFKIVGVYSTQVNAERALERHRNLPGFIKHPEGWSIAEYEIDVDDWNEGFGID